ncbi:hypothetical protein HELRODRAFT_164264 [Helobdella robusta]|uniref:Uncharacterized protein n=1 Tax=Helobdella robusta TaxID=6412 RepID=T1EV64_HELRO|nr:hypothetical protein HELRODRAFT_164264 [Helobdella robusta]ESN94424.1 hypothetical protein HELRODRAFT_164264 [Helobdella robusta]
MCECIYRKQESDGVLNSKSKGCLMMNKILQYLDCPQYLRKTFFPHQPELQFAGLLNPLDTPHHMRIHDDSLYREGVVLSKPVKPGHGSYVNVGLKDNLEVDKLIQNGVRVTVKVNKHNNSSDAAKKLTGTVVPWSEPRVKSGLYWGYRTRLAADLNEALHGKSVVAPEGYDCIIGTSDKGDNIDRFNLPSYKLSRDLEQFELK